MRNNYRGESNNSEEWKEKKQERKAKRALEELEYDAKMLVRYGEIALKGDNRAFFETGLVNQIKKHFKSVGITKFKVDRVHGRIYISHLQSDIEQVIAELQKVFGIISFSPARKCDLDFDIISLKTLEEMREIREATQGIITFKVAANRGNKGFYMQSPEICAKLGGVLLKNVKDLKVDVHNPDIEVHVDIREHAYIYTKTYKGLGGMPYGSSSKAMVLLSGGIDSPVSAYLMAKRGVKLELIHFHSYPFTSERAIEKVKSLVQKVANYTGDLRLHNVNLLEIQKEIMQKCPQDEITVLSRRFMMMIATRVAKRRECRGLITGESVAQVASQTIESLHVTNSATDLPVFRPLIAMDKVDIIKVAKEIDTYDISVLPFEDCCTVFLPERVVIKPKLEDILKSESELDKETLIKNAIENMETFTITKSVKVDEDF